jgi:4-hydroxy-3-polyprenylbenzoate decarboxylase
MDISSLRRAIESLEEQKELLRVDGEVDPVYEISGIQKALDGAHALLFQRIRGYPGVRAVGNVFSTNERVAKIFGVTDPRKLKFKCLEAMKNPIPPEVVEEAPCQEVVTTENIDVTGSLPIIKHSERDCGPILGGGNTLIMGRYFEGGSHLSFNRMSFRAKDWSTISFGIGTHLGDVVYTRHRGERIPVTINIGTPPAVNLAAGAAFLHTLVPLGTDELGIAGGLQGSPVEIVKAKTVDTYAVAASEWVIEGYIDTAQRVWESEEAEKIGRYPAAPLFPEYTGYLGWASKAFKFQVTALTHRRDPIFFTPLARSFEGDILQTPFREACFYDHGSGDRRKYTARYSCRQR